MCARGDDEDACRSLFCLDVFEVFEALSPVLSLVLVWLEVAGGFLRGCGAMAAKVPRYWGWGLLRTALHCNCNFSFGIRLFVRLSFDSPQPIAKRQ